MSRLFPEQIRIGLGASYAAMAKVHGPRLSDWHMQVFGASEASSERPIWQESLDKSMDWLTKLSPGSANIHVMLSAELAPLHLLPWRDEITSAEQQTLLARNHFIGVFGETAADWKVQVYPTAYGGGWLASALNEDLLQSLIQLAHSFNASVRTVAPLLVTQFNSRRKLFQKTSCWLLLAEPERLVALHMRKSQWQLLQILPAAALQDESLEQVLGRESRLAGLEEVPSKLFLLGEIPDQSPVYSDICKLDNGWQTDDDVDIGGNTPFHLLGAPA